MTFYAFQVYGDNLHECHKFCKLFVEHGKNFGLSFVGLQGNVDRPVYIFDVSGESASEIQLGLLPCGRYADWEAPRRPYLGYEDPDIILCHMKDKDTVGVPILGVEFNDAIEAGNNAWQRFPRISQSAEKKVPFLYVIPACDAEIKDGDLRSLRHPNIIIQIAQLILMVENQTLSLTLYTRSAWHDMGIKEGYVSRYLQSPQGEKDLVGIATELMVASSLNRDIIGDTVCQGFRNQIKTAIAGMIEQISFFIDKDFTLLKGDVMFASRQDLVERIVQHLMGEVSVKDRLTFYMWKPETILNACLPFRKSVSTDSKYREKMNRYDSYTTTRGDVNLFLKYWTGEDGMTLGRLRQERKCALIPLSYKKGANEIGFIFNAKSFAKLVEDTYPNMAKEVIQYLAKSSGPILFLPIAGYVMDTAGPAFSRPDKGLVGLMRVTFGTSGVFEARVALLYSQLIPRAWKDMLRAAKQERGDATSTQTNNLWREISKFATCVIVDRWNEGELL